MQTELRRLLQIAFECHGGKAEGDGGNDGQRHQFRPDVGDADVFKKQSVADFDEKADRVGVSQILQKHRHVFNRRYKAGKQNGRHHKGKCSEDCLLLVGTDGRNEQTDADKRKQGNEGGEDKQRERTGKRYFKKENGGQRHGRLQDQRDEKRRHGLADEDFKGRIRADDQLFKSA